MNYCLDRKYFKDGAIEINANSIYKFESLIKRISDKIELFSNNQDNLIE